MAEIKSTLDLVMEKTRNLTVTADEKKSFHTKELMAKAKGWAQKYLDGLMNADELKAVIEKEKNSEDVRHITQKALVTFLEPEENNDKIYRALEDVLKTDSRLYQKEAARFRKIVVAEKSKRTEQIRKLLRKRKISGSSVTPNLNSDETWIQTMEHLKTTFHKNLMSFD